MSNNEKYAWASMILTLIVWAMFAYQLSAGPTHGAALAGPSARALVSGYVAVVVLMVALHTILAAALGARRRGDAFRKDERDQLIEARAERVEGFVVLIAINLIVIHLLKDAAYPGSSLWRIHLGSPPSIVLALMSVLFLGHIGKQIATIWQYRA